MICIMFLVCSTISIISSKTDVFLYIIYLHFENTKLKYFDSQIILLFQILVRTSEHNGVVENQKQFKLCITIVKCSNITTGPWIIYPHFFYGVLCDVEKHFFVNDFLFQYAALIVCRDGRFFIFSCFSV
jgi:hypothetical protein